MSAIFFNMDQSKILSSGNELRHKTKIDGNELTCLTISIFYADFSSSI